MSTAIHGLVDAARAGGDPTVIARLGSGWAVFGRRQFVRGYALLLPDPVVPHLNALDGVARQRFLDDMARLGDALLQETGAVRINYAMFGNVEPALHAHVFPRYAHEPEGLRTAHPWAYDWSKSEPFDLMRHAALRDGLREALTLAARLVAPRDPETALTGA